MPDVLEWLDENSLRSFPFLLISDKTANTAYILDNRLILDLCLINPATPSVNSYCLTNIDARTSNIIFNFTNSISFTISNSLTGIQYIRGTNNSAIVINASLLSAIPTEINTFTNLQVEPSLVYEYYNDWLGVTELGFSPDYNTVDTGDMYSPALPLVSQGTQYLEGNIVFYEGYNVCLDFNVSQKLINITASDSCGIPLSCGDSFISSSNSAIDCDDIVSYINGVPPDSFGNMNIAPGPNINLVLGTSLASFYDEINPIAANPFSLFIGFTFAYQSDPAYSDICPNIPPIP